MEKLLHSCAFTGHRPHKLPWKHNEKDPRCAALISGMKEQIAKLTADGITDYYSGMAEGCDAWAALAVLELKEINPAVRLHCIVPYRAQPDKWGADAQTTYHEILARADETRELSREYYDGCLLDRNRYMVDRAGSLLAVYNGEYRGGTAATIRYAQKLSRKIIIMDPATGRVKPDA